MNIDNVMLPVRDRHSRLDCGPVWGGGGKLRYHDLSVITCAHNPRLETLKRVVEALSNQTLAKDRWEFILVDNASEVALAKQRLVEWHPAGRCVREENMGLTRARIRGIADAKGAVVVFVDDDCLLAEDYLSRTLEILNDSPHLGALGGYGRAEYANPLPAWLNADFRRFHLDMIPPASGPGLIYACVRQLGPWFPVGAGMAIRRDIAVRYAALIKGDPVALALDRTGSILSGGGDTDMVMCVIDMGLAIGNSSRLRFTHVVPEFRLEMNYMVRLLYMSQYSVAKLLVYRGWKPAGHRNMLSMMQIIKRLIGSLKRYSAEEICWQAYAKGFADGLCGVSLDKHFCT